MGQHSDAIQHSLEGAHGRARVRRCIRRLRLDVGGSAVAAPDIRNGGVTFPSRRQQEGGCGRGLRQHRGVTISMMKHATFALASLLAALPALAQQSLESSTASAAAQANNPLANFTAFNLQNYYIGRLTSSDDSANQFWLRYATPVSVGKTDWIFRASLPVNSVPVGPNRDTKTGLGDLNAFAAYLVDLGDPAVSFGIGPLLTAPTATKDELGTEKWSAGLANVLFNARSPTFQYGYLLTWQASFAGADGRRNVNTGAFQPFAFYQMGRGTYLRAAPIWVYDFEDDTYSVPLGIGVGQVIPKGSTLYNISIEPQWSVADKGGGYPKWQIFLAFNMQFTK